MYSRFTVAARNVMESANEEAKRLQQEHITTGHVLLGMIKESAGMGTTILTNLHINLENLKIDIEKQTTVLAETIPPGKLPLTRRVKEFIDHAREEARILGSEHVDTEHLLFGLLKEEEGTAAEMLKSRGVTLETAKAKLTTLLQFSSVT